MGLETSAANSAFKLPDKIAINKDIKPSPTASPTPAVSAPPKRDIVDLSQSNSFAKLAANAPVGGTGVTQPERKPVSSPAPTPAPTIDQDKKAFHIEHEHTEANDTAPTPVPSTSPTPTPAPTAAISSTDGHTDHQHDTAPENTTPTTAGTTPTPTATTTEKDTDGHQHGATTGPEKDMTVAALETANDHLNGTNKAEGTPVNLLDHDDAAFHDHHRGIAELAADVKARNSDDNPDNDIKTTATAAEIDTIISKENTRADSIDYLSRNKDALTPAAGDPAHLTNSDIKAVDGDNNGTITQAELDAARAKNSATNPTPAPAPAPTATPSATPSTTPAPAPTPVPSPTPALPEGAISTEAVTKQMNQLENGKRADGVSVTEAQVTTDIHTKEIRIDLFDQALADPELAAKYSAASINDWKSKDVSALKADKWITANAKGLAGTDGDSTSVSEEDIKQTASLGGDSKVITRQEVRGQRMINEIKEMMKDE